MFQSLVIMLREGVEAALIVGIVAGYLRKTGRAAWIRVVLWALAAAIVASVAAAYVVHRLEVSEDAYEGWLMLIGAGFVGSMVIWMWRTGSRMKKEIETRLSSLSAEGQAGDTVHWGLFAFVFLMVFREGIETVLFLAAVSLRTTELMSFIGGVIGLGLAVGLGVAFFKGSLRVNLKKFFAVTTAVLMVVALQLLVSGLHELSEARVLPSGQREMALIGPIVNNDVLFFVIVVALCLFLVLAQRIRETGLTDQQLAALDAPQRRKVRAAEKRARFWKMSASVAGLLTIIFISAEFVDSRSAQAVSPPEPLAIAHEEARVPLATLNDHKLHHFLARTAEGDVRIIAVLDGDDTIHAGLDACMICGAKGYYQDGPNIICRNCAAAINAKTIGMPGGCNPFPIEYRVESGVLIFPERAVTAGTKMFR
jgi:FTR1 family protein